MWSITAYPTGFDCISLETGERKTFFWDLTGPVVPFTAEQDFLKRQVRIYGEATQGYFRVVVSREDQKIILFIEKTPEGGLPLLDEAGHLEKTLFKGDQIELFSTLSVTPSENKEQLFLGNNKQRDWDQIRKRRDPAEFLPLWHFVGQDYSSSLEGESGTFVDLLLALEKKIEAQDKNVLDLLSNLYFAGFSGGLVPRAYDEERQGLVPFTPFIEEEKIPPLLGKGANLIRSLFFKEEEGVLSILPSLPSSFVFGKLLNIMTADGCKIDLEWSKRQIRTMYIFSENKKTIHLKLPSDMKRYRVRSAMKDKGRVVEKGESFVMESGQTLLLDRFQK